MDKSYILVELRETESPCKSWLFANQDYVSGNPAEG